MFPSENRIRGEHIANYSEYLKSSEQRDENEDKHVFQFAAYKKRGLLPEDVPKHFDQTKEKIMRL